MIDPHHANIYLYDSLFLPVYILYGLTCEGIHALDRHGAFDSPLKGTLQDGVYNAADGTFSVIPPAGLGIHEEYYPSLDYVLFAPRRARGAIYAVNVQPQLDPIYASMSLEQFAAVALKDARFQSQLAAGLPLDEVRRGPTTLSGHPALALIYSQTPAGAAKPSVYYLLYFMKTRDRAAVLSVAWPGDCPKCATGPEVEVRAMDSALQRFVDSFELAGTGG